MTRAPISLRGLARNVRKKEVRDRAIVHELPARRTT